MERKGEPLFYLILHFSIDKQGDIQNFAGYSVFDLGIIVRHGFICILRRLVLQLFSLSKCEEEDYGTPI